MKKIYISSLLVLLMLSSLLIPNKVQAYSPWINHSKIDVYIGDTYELEIYGTSKKATWSSSDKKIVKVNKKGVVTGVSNGEAKIRAKIGKKTYSCTVTVKDKVDYEIEVTDTSIILTYSPNFGFTSIQPVIAYYDKDGEKLGTTEFTNHKRNSVGVDLIEEKELPDFKFSYYEIEFVTK